MFEKLYSVRYQKFMPNTIFTQNYDEIKKFLKKNKKIVLKPIHGYSGNDIHLIKKLNKKLINKMIKHIYIMCQKYLKITNGDKRVFLINGKIEGNFKNTKKALLSNMSKGAIAINTNLTNKEKISQLIGKDLKKKYFFCRNRFH